MTRDELLALLREQLQIDVRLDTEGRSFSSRLKVKVTLRLDTEVISEDLDYVELPSQD